MRIRSRFLPALILCAVLCVLPWSALLLVGFSAPLAAVCSGCTLLTVLAVLLARRARRQRAQALCAQLRLYYEAIAPAMDEADMPQTAEGWSRALGKAAAAQASDAQQAQALTAKFLSRWSQESLNALEEMQESARRAAHTLPVEGRLLAHEANTLRGLDEQLMRFFRCETDCSLCRIQEVELSRVISEAVLRRSDALRARQIGLRRNSTRLRTMSDPVLLAGVLDALLDNALRHTPDRGAIGLLCRETDGQAEIVVEDAGSGIPADELPHVFERGFVGRGESPAQAGLGLYTARAYCELLGHSISLRSAEGHGTQAILRLKLAPAAKAEKPAEDAAAETPAANAMQ